jgi:hypothetical protein
MMWVTLCAAGRLDDAEALAAPGEPPRRGVSSHDVRVLKQHVALLRMTPAERRVACDAALTGLARASSPLPLSTCMVAAGFGCADRAFDLIERAIDRGRPLRADSHDGFGMARAQTSLQMFVHNGGAPFHSHKRFPKLCARLGLAQYWIESGRWPDCAAQAGYDFKKACEEAL